MSARGRTLVVADAHLGSAPGDVEAFLVFLEREAAGAGNLVLLGDLFDLWLGLPALQSAAHRRVVEALRALRRRGVRIWYVEGNRDYFLVPAFAPDPFDAIEAEGLDLDLGDVRARFEHGDRINVGDRSYQRWRRFSRSRAVRRAFAAIPGRPAARLAAWLERRMRTTNAEHRAAFPEDLCRKRALEVFAGGARRLFLGHFHRAWDWGAEVGGCRCRALVVPAWQQTRAGWIYDPGRGVDGLTASGAASAP